MVERTKIFQVTCLAAISQDKIPAHFDPKILTKNFLDFQKFRKYEKTETKSWMCMEKIIRNFNVEPIFEFYSI